MIHFTPQDVFHNIARETKLTTEDEVKIAKYIIENIDKINAAIIEALGNNQPSVCLDIPGLDIPESK